MGIRFFPGVFQQWGLSAASSFSSVLPPAVTMASTASLAQNAQQESSEDSSAESDSAETSFSSESEQVSLCKYEKQHHQHHNWNNDLMQEAINHIKSSFLEAEAGQDYADEVVIVCVLFSIF